MKSDTERETSVDERTASLDGLRVRRAPRVKAKPRVAGRRCQLHEEVAMQLAEATRAIVEGVVTKAMTGSLPHADWLFRKSDEREAEAKSLKVMPPTSLADILLRELRREQT